jgi:hypothetical protein
MLFDALPKHYIDQMKKANQVPLEMPLEELRSYAPPWSSDQGQATKSAIRSVRCFFIISGICLGSGTKPFLNLTVSKTGHPKSLPFLPIY